MNNYEKQKKKKRMILIATIALIVFSAVSLLVGRKGTIVEDIFRDTVAMVENYVIKKPIRFIGNLFQEYNELKDVHEENERLREVVNDFFVVAKKNKLLESEIEELKELLGIDYLPLDYTGQVVSVIKRPMDGWTRELEIDAGSASGMELGMAVITNEGMIGTITNVSQLTSTITLLTSEKIVNQVPVLIKNGEQDVYGLISGYDSESGNYEITMITNLESLEQDAEVYTSGLGVDTKYPKGLIVGTALQKGFQDDGVSTKIYVKPAAQFDSLHYVMVVLREGTNSE